MEYIIIQAGGKGSRMQILTRNKPKALVPVNNLPMIFHLFRKYPEKKFIIIGDYKFEVLEKYLAAFADVDYQLVRGSGHSDTCAGLSDALSLLPDHERFMLIWCDLVRFFHQIMKYQRVTAILSAFPKISHAAGCIKTESLKREEARNTV